MRGQATIEAMLIIAAIIPMATAYGYMSMQTSESTNLIAGVETGVDSSIHYLEQSQDLVIDLEDVTQFGDNVIVNINLRGGQIEKYDNDIAYIENKIMEEALEEGARTIGGTHENNVITPRPGDTYPLIIEINDTRGL